MAQSPIKIAVCGDLHGHFALAWLLLERWQRQSAKQLDAILQVGDMGIWPHVHRIDNATQRFAEKDPDELSFQRDFFQGSPWANKWVRNNPVPITFVKGNHEDHEYLEECKRQAQEGKQTVSVDIYGKMRYLPNGKKTTISKGKKSLSIGGLGGTERGTGKERFTHREITSLLSQRPIDILLTHEPYQGGYSIERGAIEITELIDNLQPAYAFCGDLHRAGQELPQRGRTKVYLLNDVNFFKKRKLNPRCLGILEWSSPTKHRFKFLEVEEWFPEITKENYREQLQRIEQSHN